MCNGRRHVRDGRYGAPGPALGSADGIAVIDIENPL
jgi:hypothetical protein